MILKSLFFFFLRSKCLDCWWLQLHCTHLFLLIYKAGCEICHENWTNVQSCKWNTCRWVESLHKMWEFRVLVSNQVEWTSHQLTEAALSCTVVVHSMEASVQTGSEKCVWAINEFHWSRKWQIEMQSILLLDWFIQVISVLFSSQM